MMVLHKSSTILPHNNIFDDNPATPHTWDQDGWDLAGAAGCSSQRSQAAKRQDDDGEGQNYDADGDEKKEAKMCKDLVALEVELPEGGTEVPTIVFNVVNLEQNNDQERALFLQYSQHWAK